MRRIMDAGGLTLLIDLNRDGVRYALTMACALAAGAWLAGLGPP